MKKLLIAALAASTMSVSGAAWAFNDVDVDIVDITRVNYFDDSLDVNGNDLFSHNTSIDDSFNSFTRNESEFEIEVEDSFNTSTRSTVVTSIDVIDNDGFNEVRQYTGDSTAVHFGDVSASYNYRPRNTPFASDQNDFGDLHKITVSAVGAMAGPSLSIGRTFNIER